MATGKYQEWLEEDKIILIKGWARAGLTNEQIAHNMGIARETLNQWAKKYKIISDTLKDGKEVADYVIENALYQRAKGIEYEEVKQIIEKDALGREKKKIEKTKKFIPGDTTAQIFWLKNRKPAEWRDKREVENSFATEIENLTPLADMLRIEKDV